ncbi:hypothetical protein [uncultured Nocardioides sp.]|uniref:hypothetical protein n=1 Tax=uncultured Nocardioides sp. TaxID=198441 RepID=UPI00260DD099|nr:hypothetical protein [uncultured Nocardioides sp.]
MLSGSWRWSARSSVWLLASLTAGLVLFTAVVLAGDWRARAAGPGAAGPVLERHGLVVRLPSGAEVLAPGERLLYRDADGSVAASVAGAALLASGACPDVPGSSRGFVGVVRGDHEELVRAWSRGLAAAVGSAPTRSDVDAPAGRRTDLAVEVRLDAPCQPPRVHASLLTRSGVTVVLVRDVGAAGAIDDATAELLLASTGFR